MALSAQKPISRTWNHAKQGACKALCALEHWKLAPLYPRSKSPRLGVPLRWCPCYESWSGPAFACLSANLTPKGGFGETLLTSDGDPLVCQPSLFLVEKLPITHCQDFNISEAVPLSMA